MPWSRQAKNISSGLKKYEQDNIKLNILVGLALIPSCIIGFIFSNFWIGALAECILGAWIANSYYKS